MNTKVKICGIRSVAAAQAAIQAGTDFLGFIFVPNSRPFIEPKSAKKIIRQLTKQVKNNIKIVGVFQNAKIEEVNNIVNYLKLDYAQLHGEEDNEYCQLIQTKIIKTIKLKKDFNINEALQLMSSFRVEYFLLDRIIQGQGDMIDLDKAKYLTQKFSVFFAGGLNLENVSDAVQKVAPFGVDVASGIETNGKEDIEKIKKFISIVKNII